MADYNIYIRTDTNGQGQNPTVPNPDGPNPTIPNLEPDKEPENLLLSFQDFKGFNKGKAAFKALAGIVAIKAAAKITDSVISSVEPFVSQASGDYRFQTGYNNFKRTLSGITNPFGTLYTRLRYEQTIEITESRLEQQRTLLGDSVINNLGEYNV